MTDQPEEENVMPTPARKRTEEWEKVHSEMHWGTIPERNFVKWVCETWPLPGAKFLEIGCGVGAQVLWLSEMGHDVRAVDVSPSAIARMKMRINQAALEGTTHGVVISEIADIGARQYEHASFDCVVDICSLQHVSEVDAVLVAQRARKWLRPNGWFYMKQAIEPFDRTLNRVSFIRCGSLETIAKMFTGYPIVKVDMIREIVRGDKEVYHVIVRAQVKV
jgi:2-polyprenyl-3-methyl-5-hydroxy-6-metoxy-1,4-benzoquinol methylase